MSAVQTFPERPRYYKLAEAARKLFPVEKHPASVMRDILKGTQRRDPSAPRIKLKALCTPGGWLVTREDVEAYLAAITADRLGSPNPVRTPDPRIEAALDCAGF